MEGEEADEEEEGKDEEDKTTEVETEQGQDKIKIEIKKRGNAGQITDNDNDNENNNNSNADVWRRFYAEPRGRTVVPRSPAPQGTKHMATAAGQVYAGADPSLIDRWPLHCNGSDRALFTKPLLLILLTPSGTPSARASFRVSCGLIPSPQRQQQQAALATLQHGWPGSGALVIVT
ncbi:predicted protein [Histoplasma capsulatum H143]|uniref:Uncharacterized protein n=1 Tax=Ajellomyces capsulatus (strain H143) TaxID=544712 RepID=C6HI61_AJECH|nr:predicted protein [Histoplasma capsulatum H143]